MLIYTETEPSQRTNLVRHAQKLAADGSMPSLQAMIQLAQATGTALVGRDGRLLEIRRNRRYRLGTRSGQIDYRREFAPSVAVERFVRLDEELVADCLLDAQRRYLYRGEYAGKCSKW
jgi:hypothetical protein